ncbi:MAG: hypothetical protein ACI902_002910, partial [Psychroserpens sp.]
MNSLYGEFSRKIKTTLYTLSFFIAIKSDYSAL